MCLWKIHRGKPAGKPLMKVKRGKPQVSLKPRASSKGGVASKLQAGKPPLTKINQIVEKNKHEWM